MKKRNAVLLSTPYLIWMVLFTLIPLGVVGYYALTDPGTGEFSLANVRQLGTYLPVLWSSIAYSLVSAAVCLVIGYPVAYYIAHCGPIAQRFLYMLVMLPMCMSFLLRTLAWVGLLSDQGIINNLLVAFFAWLRSLGGIFAGIPEDFGRLTLIRTPGAVVLGMVYNYVPYMILPLYTSMTKIDQSLVEAAQDLGANTTKTLLRVLIPMSVPGISTGITMVFVPAVSTFVISRMLGGGSNLLIGDLIEMQFLGNSYNLNVGSAMSLVLMVIVLLCMSFTSSFDEDEMEGVS